jgi:hypothetical protein
VKNAYISVVLHPRSRPLPESIETLDLLLARVARSHEIVVTTSYNEIALGHTSHSKHGPVTVVTSRMRASEDQTLIAGLARAAGDFIIEWSGLAHELDFNVLEGMLFATDEGIELVEVVSEEPALISRIFLG